MKKITMNADGYFYDVVKNVFYMTESFAEKSGKFSADENGEYGIFKAIKRDNPGVKVIIQKDKRGGNGLSYERMEAFITLCADSETRLKEFYRVKALALLQPAPYAYIKSWFLERYANWNEEPTFDDDKHIIAKTKDDLKREHKEKMKEKHAESIKVFVDKYNGNAA